MHDVQFFLLIFHWCTGVACSRQISSQLLTLSCQFPEIKKHNIYQILHLKIRRCCHKAGYVILPSDNVKNNCIALPVLVRLANVPLFLYPEVPILRYFEVLFAAIRFSLPIHNLLRSLPVRYVWRCLYGIQARFFSIL